MAKCRQCGKSITWMQVNGRNIPTDGDADINIVQHKDGELVGITADGLTVRGYAVGDSCEDGYLIAKIKHICRKVDD